MTEDAVQPSVALVEGDGGDEELSAQELTRLKDAADQICRDAGRYVQSRRALADAVRFCVWDGQSDDGLKHADALGKDAFPFEGASDARVRLADAICKEAVMVMVQSALRADAAVRPLKFADGDFAGRMRYLLRWATQTHLAATYERELTRLANWVAGDSPGAAVLAVYWEEKECLKLRTVRLDEVPLLLLQMGQPPELAQDAVRWILDPTIEDMTVQWITEILPHVTAKRARRMVRELRAKGVTQFPQPYDRPGGPGITALRLFEDVFVPADTTSLADAEMLLHREWLTEVQVRERERTHGYSPKFVEQLLKQGGKTGFIDYLWQGGALTPRETPFALDPQAQSRRFEVVTAWWQAVTDDGVAGVFKCTYSCFVDVAATKRELVDLPFEGLPFEWFGLEHLTQRLWDSRGIPEVVATEQFTQKRMLDSYRDGCDLAALPPYLRRTVGGRAQAPVMWGPLQEIPTRTPGEVEFLQLPYPVGVDKAMDKLERRVAEHFGRRHPEVSMDLVRLHAQTTANNFLTPLAAALLKLLKLCQQNMSDEQLQAITGMGGQQVFATRADAEGDFQLVLSFNTGSLDSEWLGKMMENLAKYVLPILPPGSYEAAKLGSTLMANFDPSLADVVMLPMQVGQAREVDAARKALVEIMAGIEPPMNEQGVNYGLRLQTILGDLQRNPAMAAKFDPVSREILTNYLEHLAGQVDQATNAVTGRTMGRSVLQPGALDQVRQLMGKGDKTQR